MHYNETDIAGLKSAWTQQEQELTSKSWHAIIKSFNGQQ